MPAVQIACRTVLRLLLASILPACLLLAVASRAQSQPAVERLTVSQIDPPNWFSQLPNPVLLVRGTGLTGARFTCSDASLTITRADVSSNGHWAQLTLAASPARPETVTLTVANRGSELHLPYRFDAARPATDGMQGLSPRDVLYLIMTDRFADGDTDNDGPDARSPFADAVAVAERARPRGWHGGDLRGVLQHLDYLQQLGVTAVWLTPVYANDERGSYHGYGATDQYKVDPHFGSLKDLQALANELHRRGMKLVLDTVPNHVGPAHPWVQDPPAPNWFHGTAAAHLPAQFDFGALIDPHAPERDREGTLHGWFANTLPDMDTEDPAVATYLRQNAVWWIESTGADALRIDTFAFVDRGFWNAFHAELHTLFPHLTDVGEVFNPNPEITSSFAGGVVRAGVDTGLYTPFDFPTYFATRGVFGQGKPMSDLARVLASDALYPHAERLVPFLGNHDTSRFATAVPDAEARRLAIAYLLTTRGTPQLYAGDEIAMTGGDDPDNRQDFPGGFTPGQASGAFASSGRDASQQAAWSWWRQWLTLRREHAPLACGTEQVLASEKDLLLYTRSGTSSCETQPSAPQEVDLILLERGTLKPTTIDAHATALEQCHALQPAWGKAKIEATSTGWTITPQTPELLLTCQ